VWMKPLPAFLIEVMCDHFESYPFHGEFVFTTREGLLIRKRNFYRRWYEALDRARLPRMTPHSLRNTCSSGRQGRLGQGTHGLPGTLHS
jgi:integrase